MTAAVWEPLSFDSLNETQAICELLTGDPRNARDREAVVDAIWRASKIRPEISRNDVAAFLPEWVAPHVVGSTFNGLQSRKKLLPTGRHVRSLDKKGRNGNKLCPTYTVHFEVGGTQTPRDRASSAHHPSPNDVLGGSAPGLATTGASDQWLCGP